MAPLISICITTYNRTNYLEQLLNIIQKQTFRNFNVVITDNSSTAAVEELIKKYQHLFEILYYRNVPMVSMTENWNRSIEMANGEWIKIIHDDDFFVSDTSLGEYAEAITDKAKFIFSGYNSYYESNGKTVDETISQEKFAQIARSPALLFAKNVIGPPSVSMMHRSVNYYYDVHLKWFVDVEYYFRALQRDKAVYINKPLVNVSYNDSQVTNYTKTNPAVVIPESLHILNKHGKSIVSDFFAYDSWWRVFRNMQIRSIDDVAKYAADASIPPIVKRLIAHQRMIPKKLLKTGVISKTGMSISYAVNKLSGLV